MSNDVRDIEDRLPPPERIARVKAAPVSEAGNNWPIAYQTGYSGEDGEDWSIVTDSVRGSALLDLEFPADAKEDAEAIAAILNAYRTGRLVLAPMPLLPVLADAKDAEIERLRAERDALEKALRLVLSRAREALGEG